MVTVGQQGKLKENLNELQIIVRTTGFVFISSFSDTAHLKVSTATDC